MALSLALLTGGRSYILDQLEDHPEWGRTRLKSADGAVSVLVELTKQVCLREAHDLILPDIQNWYKAFVKINGPIPVGPVVDTLSVARDNWVEAHDDGLMEVFEAFQKTLSASWLNEMTTDARLWEAGEDERLAIKFAEETWKQLTWQRTDKQILAGVGIVADDLAQYGELGIETTIPQLEYKPTMINAIINRIMMFMPDPAQLAEDLDFASDTDEGLAAGAAQRLGISPADAVVMQQARKQGAKPEAWRKAIEGGEMLTEDTNYVDLSGVTDTFDAGPEVPANLVRNALPPPPPPPVGTVREALQASVGAVPPPPPPPPPPLWPSTSPTNGVGAAPPTNTGRGGKRTPTPKEAPAGSIDKDILRSIKEHAGFKDEVLADILGISRPTLANIMKGKGWYVPPDQTRRDALRNTLVKHVNELTSALNAIYQP